MKDDIKVTLVENAISGRGRLSLYARSESAVRNVVPLVAVETVRWKLPFENDTTQDLAILVSDL